MAPFTVAVTFAVASLTLLASPARADDLAPWRVLARGTQGLHLLAIARAALSPVDSAGVATVADSAFEWPPPPAALYVTLARGTVTRACVGHEPPRGADVAEAVRALAAQMRLGDRRRAPVRADELPRLRLVIGFASAAEPIADPMQIDPGREGLLIESERGRVAFLPGEARTVDWALREARRIGVLSGSRGAARYFRFSVVALSEAVPPAAPMEDADAAP